MFLQSPNFSSHNLIIYDNNIPINFTLLTKYLVNNHTLAWTGKDSSGNLLTLTITKGLCRVNYLSSKGYYFGHGKPQQDIPLFFNPEKEESFKCFEPQITRYFAKNFTNKLVDSAKDDVVNPKIPFLIISILFIYSPEVLITYLNTKELEADNNDLCAIAAGIFTANSTEYLNICVLNVATEQVDDLQQGNVALTYNEVQGVLQCYIHGGYPEVTALKLYHQANVVVFIPLLGENALLFGVVPNIGFQKPTDTCLALARSIRVSGQRTAKILPTLLSHELGHLLGCSHPLLPFNQLQTHLLPGYGHHILSAPYKSMNDARNGTLMSYAHNRVWHYSNPNLFAYAPPDHNIPCGVAGISEAHKVVEANLPRLAAMV